MEADFSLFKIGKNPIEIGKRPPSFSCYKITCWRVYGSRLFWLSKHKCAQRTARKETEAERCAPNNSNLVHIRLCEILLQSLQVIDVTTLYPKRVECASAS